MKSTANYNILMANPHPLPSSAPESLQTIQTAAALAKNVSVHLIACKSEKESISSYYNLHIPDTLHICYLPTFKADYGFLRPSWNLPFFLLTLFMILRLAQKSRVNVIFLRNLKLARFLLRWRYVLKLPPVIFEIHEIFAFSFHDELKIKEKQQSNKAIRLSEIERYVYENADGIVCTTSHAADTVKNRYNLKCPIHIAPNGVDSSILDQCSKEILDKKINNISKRLILYLGSLHHWKGIDVLIEALQYIPDAYLQIVGGDIERIKIYRETAKRFNVEKNVHFEGFVEPHKRFRYMSHADVCILPLKPVSVAIFSSPIKLFEYMAVGKPIVASDLPSIREIIKNNVNGILVPPEEPEILGEAINRILDDNQLGSRLALQAKNDVKEFTWDKRAEKISSFLRSNWS
jgi:glycosyltransferase involved in cell wall biosynthesis